MTSIQREQPETITSKAPETETEVMLALDRLRPVLERHRQEGETERMLPAAVLAALRAEGMFNLVLPREYGGAEVDFVTYLNAVEELSRIDSAAGWILANSASAGVMAAYLPEESAQEIFATGAFGAGSAAPRGQAIPVEGGFRITGRWPLTSGCQHAEWLAGLCIVFENGAPRMGPGGMPDLQLAFFPSTDCEIIDTWYSMGMRGTGSSDVVVQDLFVPARRAFPLFTAQPRLASAAYKIRIDQYFFTSLATVGLGIARSAIDEFVALAQTKVPTMSQDTLATRATVHAEVARAEARYQSARAYLHEVAREMMETAATSGGVPEHLEARRRLACISMAESCEQVVDSLFRLAGTTAIYSGNRLEQCLRDIHTVNQHLAVSSVWWEKTGQYYLGQGLGMP